ncbi:MAG: GNAT family N-acetyltransferase, partial [Chloroflexota bacterium]
IAELEQVVDLEMLVWGLPARDAVPSGLLHAMVNTGSLVVGASEDNKLIGTALMFPTDRVKPKRLWSHMAAVDPAYQGQGIGFELKQFQRNWALENGYQEIGWTFDPLQRGNANFNLHVLGGATNTYHINFYGEMTDGINAGLPSDRVEVIWKLRNSRVKRLSGHKAIPPLLSTSNISDEHYLLRSIDDQPISKALQPKQKIYLAEIPASISTLKQRSKELAVAWRIALRNTFQTAFQAGYTAHDFIAVNGRYFYMLVEQQSWYMYVLECSDQTLYTGITPDLSQRVLKHNSGRGAAYTKTRRPVRLVAAWQFPNRQAAMKAEIAFKRLQRQTKLDHIAHKQSFRDALFVDYDV